MEYEFIDAFEWTPELLADYADRTRALSGSVGSDSPGPDVPRFQPGVCADCRKTVAARSSYGQHELELCERDFTARRRVGRELIELKATAAPPAGPAPSGRSVEEKKPNPKEDA